MRYNIIKWQVLSFAALSIFASCNNQRTEQSSTSDSSTNTAAVTDTSSAKGNNEKDQQFVKEVVAGNIGEIKMAKLAQQKAANKEVKDLGKMLEKDHSAVLEQLKTYASKKNIQVPAEETQEAKDGYNDFTKKSGKEFDKDWCEMMEKKHKEGISKFEDFANNSSADQELRSLVNKTLPTLRTHLDHVMQCKNKLK